MFQAGIKTHLMLDMSSNCSAISTTYVCSGIICILVFISLHFVLSGNKALNSLEQLYITWVAAINSFARVLNLQGGEAEKKGI